jgi:hypothetical protein
LIQNLVEKKERNFSFKCGFVCRLSSVRSIKLFTIATLI